MPITQALAQTLQAEINTQWETDILPQLKQYITIPNKSPLFDPNWKTNGYMDQAMQLIVDWVEQQPIHGLHMELLEDEGHTPLLFAEIPGHINDTILIYGHMDKQPEMAGWDDDLAPWKAVEKDGKLYGRGGADDGYAVFAALTAIAKLQAHNLPHARIVLIIEGCEESGSADLPHYLSQLAERIGTPNLVIGLDSGADNYEQMWSTTSLRGVVSGTLHINVLKDGVHSGVGSGVVPNPSLILRQLLSRLEDPQTGEFILKDFHVNIPTQRRQQAEQASRMLGDKFLQGYPFLEGVQPIHHNTAELILNHTWRPQLSVTGQDGLPSIATAGNVTLPALATKISVRLPPTLNAEQAATQLKATLEAEPPFNAQTHFDAQDVGSGWHAPTLAPWLANASDKASHLFFNKPCGYKGEGGSIPFMGMLGDQFPNAQFLITGVLGPKSNAHGPNEFLHIPFVKKLTGCVAAIIAEHYDHHA